MRGLPHTYRNEAAMNGTLIEINVSSEAGGTWYLEKNQTGWDLNKENKGIDPYATITLNPDIAWKVFTKGLKPELAIEKSVLSGDDTLAKKMFNMIAVMA
jgi:hypothetical protein